MGPMGPIGPMGPMGSMGPMGPVGPQGENRRLGGESNREIVSCRACVRAVRMPGEIRARNVVLARSLFPFRLGGFPFSLVDPPSPPTSYPALLALSVY